ncbi:MAG TPA: hypothetical protein VNA20_16275 [Frankiaceae bacterium]|nr:hypothetical protein [Frankiaceae bacterium]
MSGKEIGGLILITAGVAWMFLAQLGYLTRRRRAAGGVETAALDDIIKELVKRLPTLQVPGAVMIAFGAYLLADD